MGPPDGRRVVLVPGATGSKEDFRRVLPLLAAAGYRAESFDLAGQFESAGAGP
jgi:alpha-beta hydrolase superfamily lysophospholipase